MSSHLLIPVSGGCVSYWGNVKSHNGHPLELFLLIYVEEGVSIVSEP
jgi:hypothetical protein